jgi:hypothetical protein
MLNFIVRGVGVWLLQNCSVTSKTARCDTHRSEPQISLHAVCTSVMSLSVRKYKTSTDKVTLLSLSPCKHWTADGGGLKVSMQFMKFLFVSSVLWVCPESRKACGFEGKRDSWVVLLIPLHIWIHLILNCWGGGGRGLCQLPYVIHLICVCWGGCDKYVSNPYSQKNYITWILLCTMSFHI